MTLFEFIWACLPLNGTSIERVVGLIEYSKPIIMWAYLKKTLSAFEQSRESPVIETSRPIFRPNLSRNQSIISSQPFNPFPRRTPHTANPHAPYNNPAHKSASDNSCTESSPSTHTCSRNTSAPWA